MWADDAACAPCEATECSGGLQPCSGCSRFEVSLVCDAMARGGGAEAGARVRAEARSGPSSSDRAQDDLLDAAARSQRAGRSNDVLDLLAAESRVSEETWHGLGRDRHGDRAFSHSCGRMCLHGMARHEPDKFRFLNEKLKAARKAVKEHAAGQAVAATGGATVYDQDILGVAPTELHAAAKELRAEEHSEGYGAPPSLRSMYSCREVDRDTRYDTIRRVVARRYCASRVRDRRRAPAGPGGDSTATDACGGTRYFI
jgi:hypothetical protein